jgi:hypothetical protein
MGQNYDTGGALRRPFEAPCILNVFQFFLSLRSESQLMAQTAPRTTRRT